MSTTSLSLFSSISFTPWLSSELLPCHAVSSAMQFALPNWTAHGFRRVDTANWHHNHSSTGSAHPPLLVLSVSLHGYGAPRRRPLTSYFASPPQCTPTPSDLSKQCTNTSKKIALPSTNKESPICQTESCRCPAEEKRDLPSSNQ